MKKNLLFISALIGCLSVPCLVNTDSKQVGAVDSYYSYNEEFYLILNYGIASNSDYYNCSYVSYLDVDFNIYEDDEYNLISFELSSFTVYFGEEYQAGNVFDDSHSNWSFEITYVSNAFDLDSNNYYIIDFDLYNLFSFDDGIFYTDSDLFLEIYTPYNRDSLTFEIEDGAYFEYEDFDFYGGQDYFSDFLNYAIVYDFMSMSDSSFNTDSYNFINSINYDGGFVQNSYQIDFGNRSIFNNVYSNLDDYYYENESLNNQIESLGALNGVFDLIKSSIGSTVSLLDFEIAPNFTLGILIVIPLAISVILFVFKMLG